MNYRHIYHAGNFADVFKHVILVMLMQSLLKKENPFCYLETHAGIGWYDLSAREALINKEYELGIKKILARKDPPGLIKDYLACIGRLCHSREGGNDRDGNTNDSDDLRYYPGSPFFAKQFLRPQDQMILSELHDDDVKSLKQFFKHDKQVHIHHQDGYLSLKSSLPPKEKRGLVLIDPPYEKSDELNSLASILAQALKRWETGIYALWYPIKTKTQLNFFFRELKEKISRPFLRAELCVYAENIPTELNGCGMVIVNPPWQFEENLQAILPWLWETLSVSGQGRFEMEIHMDRFPPSRE